MEDAWNRRVGGAGNGGVRGRQRKPDCSHGGSRLFHVTEEEILDSSGGGLFKKDSVRPCQQGTAPQGECPGCLRVRDGQAPPQGPFSPRTVTSLRGNMAVPLPHRDYISHPPLQHHVLRWLGSDQWHACHCQRTVWDGSPGLGPCPWLGREGAAVRAAPRRHPQATRIGRCLGPMPF